MNPGLAAAALFALLDWFAVERKSKRLEYIFKPATMLAILAGALIATQVPHDPQLAPWFIVGFTFSLAGDIALMASPRGFLLGLVAFLLAHLAYSVGLNPTLPPRAAFVFLLVPALVVGGLAAAAPVRALRRHHPSLVLPVVVYASAITLMLFSAWATLFRPEWDAARRALVMGGATLFFISDALLARNRFVAPFPAARLAVIITYHLGQLALAAAIPL